MLRLPTFVCYVLIGVGLGMCVAIQTITLHQIPIPDSSLFRYHMHEDENKPIMRGLLHTISAFLSLVTLAVSTLTNRHRHPSDFVMAYFCCQYFASAVYHRNQSNIILTGIFVNVDIGWIAATIIGSSAMIRFRKKRHVGFLFLTVVSTSIVYEVVCRGLLSNYNVTSIYENFQQKVQLLEVSKLNFEVLDNFGRGGGETPPPPPLPLALGLGSPPKCCIRRFVLELVGLLVGAYCFVPRPSSQSPPSTTFKKMGEGSNRGVLMTSDRC